MSSTFTAVEEEKKPRRLLGAKSLVVTGLAAAGASQAQRADAQFVVNTTTVSQGLGAGSLNITSRGGSSGPTALNSLTQINLSNAADLIGVTFSYSGGISQSAAMSVPASTSTLTGTLTFNDTLVLSSNANLFTTGATVSSYNLQGGPYRQANHTLSAGTQNPTNSGTAVPNSAGNSQTTTLLNIQSPGLGGFVGTGTLGMSLGLSDASSYSGSGNTTAFDAQNTAAAVSVTYTYLTGSDTGGLLKNGSFELPAQIEAATTNGGLPNGGFLYGTQSATTGLTVSASTLNAVPNLGWTFNGQSGIARNGSNFNLANAGSGGSDGDQAALVQSAGNMTQSFTANAGPGNGNNAAGSGVYKLSFVAEQRTGNNQDFEVEITGTFAGPGGTTVGQTTGTMVLNVSANAYNGLLQAGYNNATGDINPTSSSAWNSYSLYTPYLIGGNSYTIEILGLDTAGGDNTAFIDTVNLGLGFTSVPGPTAISVFSGAAPLLLLSRRRRSRKRVA